MMNILVVTCKLVFAMEAVLPAILTANNVAWKCRGLGAMFGAIVTLQVTPMLEGSGTIFLGAFVFILVDVMGFLVVT